MRGLSQRPSVADVARHRPLICRNLLINLIKADRRMAIGQRNDDWPDAAIAGSDTCILKQYLFFILGWIICPLVSGQPIPDCLSSMKGQSDAEPDLPCRLSLWRAWIWLSKRIASNGFEGPRGCDHLRRRIDGRGSILSRHRQRIFRARSGEGRLPSHGGGRQEDRLSGDPRQ